MSPVHIRTALPEDSAAMVDILFRAWCATYVTLGVPEAAIIESFGDRDKKIDVYAEYIKAQDVSARVVLVAENDEGVVCGLCVLNKKDEIWRLSQFYVDPTWIRMGIGSALMAEAIDRANTDIELSVVVNNDRAIAFYTAQGFAPTGETSKYQLTNTVYLDEIVMRRSRAGKRVEGS